MRCSIDGRVTSALFTNKIALPTPALGTAHTHQVVFRKDKRLRVRSAEDGGTRAAAGASRRGFKGTLGWSPCSNSGKASRGTAYSLLQPVLNLALCDSCALPDIHNAVGTVREVRTFFSKVCTQNKCAKKNHCTKALWEKKNCTRSVKLHG